MTTSDRIAGALVLALGGLAFATRSGGSPERPQPTLESSPVLDPDLAAATTQTEPDRPIVRNVRAPEAETRIVEARRATPGLDGALAQAGRADGLQLTASFARHDRTLVLRYRVVNARSTPVFLFSPLQRYDFDTQRWAADPARVYGRRRRGRTIELAKQLVPLKAGTLTYAREVPLLTRLAPGQALEETLRLPLPLDLRGPRKTQRGHATGRRIQFAVGYLTQAPASLRPSGSAGHYTVSYGQGLAAQRVLTSGPIHLALPVR